MGSLKLVPFVVIQGIVRIEVQRTKNVWLGIGKVSFKFIPTDQTIAPRIHIAKMGIERLRGRHRAFMEPVFSTAC